MNENPIFALNIMFLAYDEFYLIRDIEWEKSHHVQEFVASGGYEHDNVLSGFKVPRTVLEPVQPESFGADSETM